MGRLSQAQINSLTDAQKLPITLNGTDAAGEPADFTGVVTTFTVTPVTGGQVQPDPADTANSGTKWLFVPAQVGGTLGNAHIDASAAVPGSTVPLTGSIDVNVAAGAPINLTLTPGTPQ